MEKRTFEITLDDGTQIKDLEQNGNNYISAKELTTEDFAGKLGRVKITGSDGTEEAHENMELVQITKDQGKYWFVLRELTEEEIFRRGMQSRMEYMAMMSDIDFGEEA